MASSPKPALLLLLLIFFFFFFSSSSSSTSPLRKKQKSHPCKELVLYFHDIIYNGSNIENVTSAIVAAPQGSNFTAFGPQFRFGDVVVFDDPITLDNNLHSAPIGRAQGIYVYDNKNIFAAWLGFTFSLNSTAYKGTISFVGADPLLVNKRDISVVVGTGDFFMHRGVATIITDTAQGNAYFCLQLHTKFYDCW